MVDFLKQNKYEGSAKSNINALDLVEINSLYSY